MSEKKSNWHLYVFLGELAEETHWWELYISTANLRSRTSLLLTNNHENLMLLWHGCGTTDEQQILAHQSVMKLRERYDGIILIEFLYVIDMFVDVQRNFISKVTVKILNFSKCKKVMK